MIYFAKYVYHHPGGSMLPMGKDKIGHKSGGSAIFTSICYKSRLFLGFFPVQNTNFHEGVQSISNICPYHFKKFIKKSKF